MPVQIELPKHLFRNAVRMIKLSSVDRIELFVQASTIAMKRLKVKPNSSKVIPNLPNGSKTFNMRTLFDWMDKIGPKDKYAIRQLVKLDATARVRI